MVRIVLVVRFDQADIVPQPAYRYFFLFIQSYKPNIWKIKIKFDYQKMSVHFYAREKQCSLCFGGTAETADGGGEAAVALPAAMFVGIAALVVGACT